MKWLKHKEDTGSNGYWDTISDVMSSLLLSLLLVVMLLILYVAQAPDYNSEEAVPESVIVDNGEEEQYIDREAGNAVVKTDVPYLYSDSVDEEYGQGEQTGDYEYEDGGFEEGEFDGHEGAAVRVIVEDAETHTAIPQADVTFSLYTSEGRGTRLYTYYPTRTPWTRFVTDESGTFYLPQKLVLASYFLHELTAPAGYEAAEDVSFSLDQSYTWDNPYIVHVALNSIRNTIHITAVDSVSNEPVPDSVFDIIAAQDIKTNDGTVRYTKGTVVDRITCDEVGEGRSIALYLGNYVIQQSGAPEYYAVSPERYEVTLGDEENAEDVVEQVVLCEKTRFTVSVVDELYPSMPIEGAEFLLQDDKGTQIAALVTDDQGSLTLDSLDKQTIYTLTQSGAPEGYQAAEKEITFYVDENGLISDHTSADEQITNRTLRLSVIVKDALFSNPVSGCRVELYNDKEQLLHTWQSTNVETVVQGMPAGQYRLEVSGTGSATINVQIEDTAQVQSICSSVWTMGNKLVVGCAAVLIGGIGAGTGLILKKRKQRRKQAAK